MKKITFKNYVLAFILLTAIGMKSQNLVLNPSFENFTPAPIIGCAGSGYGNVTNWYNPDVQDSCSTPDWYSSCTTLLGATPNASFGYQVAHTGSAYAGIISKDQTTTDYREYIEGQLSSPLTAGQNYCISFYVSLGNKSYLYCNNFGMYLSNSLTQYPTNYCKTSASHPLTVTPQLNYTCTVTDTTNWVRLQWNYTATGGEQYFTIGNFFNDGSTTSGVNNAGALLTGPFAYYYIDDVSISPGVCCAADILPQAPLCVTAPSVTLSATSAASCSGTSTVTGVWSGAGITNTTTGVFDPSVAGAGTHVISYSLSCGYVATTTITVNACASLSVCQSGGNFTVSGGTPTYTWSVWNSGGSTPITTQAQCLACNSNYTWVFGTCLNGITPVTSCITPAGWQQFATGATVTPPGTYPIEVQDASSNSYTITSSASVANCSGSCVTPTVSTSATNSVTCYGASTGSATVSVSPAGTYTVTWQPGNLTGLSQSGLAAGTYTVTADAGGGCTGSANVVIAQPAAPLSASITVNPATCGINNGNATVTASGGTSGYTYTWSPSGGNGSTAANLAPGVYTVAVSDAHTCTISATGTVTGTPALTVTVNNATICAGTTATLTAHGATTYSWTPGTNLSSTNTASVAATPTGTTVYTVTGTSGSCSATATSTVTVKSQPTFTVNKVNLCKGDSALLIASDNSLSYTWTPATGLNTTNNDSVKASPSSTTVYTITGSNGGTCSVTTITDSVIVLNKPLVSVLSPTVCSATTATISASGALSYTWTPLTNLTHSITNDTVYVNNPTAPVSYTVTGTAANGCTASSVSQVYISNHLGILSGTPVNSCFGDYLGMSALGASTYTWTSNNITNLHFVSDTGHNVVADIANVGSYTVAIYGESHSGMYCNGYDTVIVMVHPTPTVTAVSNTTFTICAGSSATLTATSGGASAYSWSPSSGLSSPNSASTVASPSSSTIYTVTGSTAFGCRDAISYSVTVIAIPTFTLTSASLCAGQSATLTATPTSADAATYTWSPGASLNTNMGTTVIANPSTTTIYTVNATTTIAGCASLPKTTTVTIHQLPNITVAPTSTTICSGSTTNLIASDNSLVYNWNPTSAISGSPNTATVIANPASTTIYTVSGTDVFGCASNTVTATVNVTIVSASPSAAPVCKGQTIQLTTNAIGGATYSWTGPNGFTSNLQNPTIANASAANAGTYTLSTTTGGCTATNTVLVTVNAPPVITITPSQTVCPNSPANITAGGASTYTWSPATGLNATTGNVVTATSSVTTNYSVTGTDANGCYSSATTILVVKPITAAISANPPSGDFPLHVQFTNSSSGGTVYAWDYGNGATTYTTTSLTDPNTNTTYSTTGTYTVVMTTVNSIGCMDSAMVTIVVTEAFTLTIPNIFTPNGDGINDNFFVKSTGLASIDMVIYDRWGLKMWESSSASGAWDGKNAVDGTYFYVIKATSTKSETKEYKGPLTLIK